MLDDFKIGHYTDSHNKTGATVIICEDGAVGGVSVRGASPATRETDLLDPKKQVEVVHAVTLSGGSAFGLEASSGVMQYLFERNIGYPAGGYNVPIVVGASIYDLEKGNFAYPDKQAGYTACENAKVNNFEKGSIGAGRGATVGKLLGMSRCSKSGLGVATMTIGKVEIAVIVSVNALGNIVKNGKTLLGVKGENGFIDANSVLQLLSEIHFKNSNTIIGCVLTNARLTKAQANQLADIAHDGLALSVSPSHTPFDGDAIFALSSNKVDCSFIILNTVLPNLVARAVQSVCDL